MGVVYKARQAKLNRLVALKMILSGAHAGSAERQRFLAEAEAVARLQHANIVQIHEVGEADGHPFFSLEFCPGGSLAAELEGTPLPPLEAAGLVETLARAMHAAHGAGVVHRDLKPANVLLGADGTPKVTDFGLAKKLDDTAGQTASGTIMGTPSYMAPEQAGGRLKEVGPATDVYALGAVLYELLTGRPPFRAATPLDTVLQVISEEPVPPGRLNPKVPRDLETVCLKCLQKEPARRYASAEALADDLRRFLEERPITARPVGAWERAWRWCRRNPWLAGLAASVAALLLVLTGVATGAAIWLDRERNDAVASQKRAEAAERDKTDKLWQSYLDRARAGRFSRLRGQRFDSLEALRAAAAIRYDLRLRNEAIACLALADLRPAPPGTRFPGPGQVAAATIGQRTALDPAGRLRATAEGTVVVVRDPAGEVLLRLTHPAQVDTVLMSGNGRLLAVACHNRNVYVRLLPTGQLLGVLEGQALLSHLEFGPSGLLLTEGFDGASHLWDAVGCRLLVRCPDNPVVGPFGADNDLLANHGSTWQLADGRECRVLNPLEESRGAAADRVPTWNVQFSPDGRLLATATSGGVLLWDAVTGDELARVPVAPGTGGIHFLNDGSLCTAGPSGLLRWPVRPRDGAGAALQVGPPRLLLPWTHVGPGPIGQDKAATYGASHDGRWLAVAEPHTSRAYLLDPDHPADARPLPGQFNCLYAAVSPDGRWAATSSWAFNPPVPIKIWDTATATCVHQITQGSYATVTFTPDSRWLVTGGKSGYQFWEAGTWRRGRSFPRSSNLPGPAAFSPDGRLMAVVPSNFVVRLVDPETGDEIATLTPPNPGLVSALCFNGDGSRLAVATENNPTFVWDLRAIRRGLRGLQLDWDLPDYAPEPRRVDRLELQVADRPGSAGPAPELPPRSVLTGHKGPVSSVAFDPHHGRLASGGLDRTIMVWDTDTGKALRNLPEQAREVWSVAFSPDGERLASASGGHARRDLPGELILWEAATGKKVLTLPSPGGGVHCLAFRPDGQRPASVGFDRTVRVWDVSSGKESLTIPGHSGELWGVAYSPDGKLLASAGFDKSVRLWDADTGEPVRTLEGHTDVVWSVAFSPDGKRLVSTSDDLTVRVWDVASGEKDLVLVGHTVSPYGAVFSPDGKYLASASGHRWQPRHPGEVIVWAAETGKPLTAIPSPTSGFFGVSFSPDSKHLASAGMDASVRVWDVVPASRGPEQPEKRP
jgi:WD40 repeat protein/tRNA A-37 threonylcarbamoyl transferase component Bud32